MLEDLRKILKKKDQDKELTLPTFKINISHFPALTLKTTPMVDTQPFTR